MPPPSRLAATLAEFCVIWLSAMVTLAAEIEIPPPSPLLVLPVITLSRTVTFRDLPIRTPPPRSEAFPFVIVKPARRMFWALLTVTHGNASLRGGVPVRDREAGEEDVLGVVDGHARTACAAVHGRGRGTALAVDGDGAFPGDDDVLAIAAGGDQRSEEHTSE